MAVLSPQLGFNDNVQHRGQIFHIQTEDSGVKYPHVITHLFADGGRILKTVKTSYAEHVGAEKLTDVVRDLMKRQHRAMYVALRAGRLDEVIDAPPMTVSPRSRVSSASVSAIEAAPPSLASFRRITAPEPFAVPAAEAPVDLEALERIALGAVADAAPLFEDDASPPAQYAPARPAAIFGAPPRGLDRATAPRPPTLDEVILQFLADDAEGGPGAR